MTHPGYEHGWQRYGFDTLDFTRRPLHGGSVDVDVAVAFDRGLDRPLAAFVVVPPGGTIPALGLHMQRGEAREQDSEEWYIVIEGTGIHTFTNGDAVEFGPGDLIAIYPGTGHALEVTGDTPVKFIGILPEVYVSTPTHSTWPETWEPRIAVLTTTPENNPTTAQCTDCGARWELPPDDPGSHSLTRWAADHPCTREGGAVRLGPGERREAPAG